MTIKTNKHDKTYQEQMPKSFFQKGCCNHYLYTVYNTTSFFFTSLVILIKLNLIALLPNLLFFVFNKPNMTHWQVIHRVTA